ncbi:hypothetical protein M440DRAFT_114002 [Trichoderma longibrachiatum ATCC 18648]|uniref:Secreted protein n=1 Tax=Trichoderma longibrachiatum ATCC 18648 TaxID=983965 RepID=A0A2T4BYJ2_TRILO|nr:hypothetical protein M440DRAFT_114002 [Trichoderma longibrachiatum ATCC 18648]
MRLKPLRWERELCMLLFILTGLQHCPYASSYDPSFPSLFALRQAQIYMLSLEVFSRRMGPNEQASTVGIWKGSACSDEPRMDINDTISNDSFMVFGPVPCSI